MNGADRLRGYLRNTTQSELSRRSGVPQCQISLYASGTRRPGRLNANRLEKATDGAVPATSWDERSRSRPLRTRTA